MITLIIYGAALLVLTGASILTIRYTRQARANWAIAEDNWNTAIENYREATRIWEEIAEQRRKDR